MSRVVVRFILAAAGCLAALPLYGQLARTDRFGDPLPAGAIARMGSLRFHHPGGIITTAFVPDGKTVMAIGQGKDGFAVRFWEVATGSELSRYDLTEGDWGGHLRGAMLSPDGRSAAINRQGPIELYDRRGKLLRSFGGEHYNVSIAFSPDGTLLVAGSFESKDDNPIRVWEVATGKELPPFPGSGASLNALTFSADGKRLYSGPVQLQRPNNGGPIPAAICAWDVATRKKLHEIPHGNTNVAFAPRGDRVARDKDGIEVIAIATGKTVCKIGEQHSTFAFDFTPDGKALVTLDRNRTLQLWDAATGKELRRFAGHVGQNGRLGGISADGKLLALMDGDWQSDGVLRVWNIATGEEVLPAAGHEDAITHLAFAPNGKLLASASLDGTVRIWEAASGKEVHRLIGHNAAVAGVAFAPDGKTLASSSDDGTTRLWSVADGQQVASFKNPSGNPMPWQGGREKPYGGTLAFSADGKTLLVVGKSGMAGAWDMAAKKELRRRVLPETSSVAPVLLPSLNAALTDSGGAWGGDQAPPEALHLWDLSTGELMRTMLQREVREDLSHIVCAALAASADGTLLVSSQQRLTHGIRAQYTEPSLCIRERITGKEVLRIKDTVAQALAFSPDSRLLAANDNGLTIKGGRRLMQGGWFGKSITLHDPWTGEPHGALVGHTGPVVSLAFAPDGKLLASGSADHTILIWNVPPLKKVAAGDATAAQVQAWWQALGGADAAAAYQASAHLAANGGLAVPLARTQLKPAVAPAPKVVAGFIADLDSVEFAVRERATVALEALGDLAEPALRKAYAMPPSLEVRRRIEALRARAAALSPARVRNLRALMLLERIDNADARATLAALAQGAPGALLTREAQAALRRLSANTQR